MEITGIEQEIRDLQQDIDRTVALPRELGQLQHKEEVLSREVASHAASLAQIVSLESALSAAKLKLEAPRKAEQIARRDKETRQRLVDALEKAGKEHKRIEDDLARSEERVRASVENMPDAFSIYSAVRDETGAITNFSRLLRWSARQRFPDKLSVPAQHG